MSLLQIKLILMHIRHIFHLFDNVTYHIVDANVVGNEQILRHLDFVVDLIDVHVKMVCTIVFFLLINIA